MSILSFIKKISVQDAVYWGPPTSDGVSDTFPTPEEIKCRWDGSAKLITDKKGRQYVCMSEIMSPAECELGGLIYLGTLESLTAEQLATPRDYAEIFEIQKVEKTPLFGSATQFVFTTYT